MASFCFLVRAGERPDERDWDLFTTAMRLIASLFVKDPIGGEFEGEGGKEGDDEEQDPGHGRTVAHLEGAEGALVEVKGVKEGAVEGAAAGDDEGLGEDEEAADHLDDEVKEDDGGEHGQGDVEEFFPAAAAVNGGGFVEFGGNLAQAGQEDEHRGAELPD